MCKKEAQKVSWTGNHSFVLFFLNKKKLTSTAAFASSRVSKMCRSGRRSSSVSSSINSTSRGSEDRREEELPFPFPFAAEEVEAEAADVADAACCVASRSFSLSLRLAALVSA